MLVKKPVQDSMKEVIITSAYNQRKYFSLKPGKSGGGRVKMAVEKQDLKIVNAKIVDGTGKEAFAAPRRCAPGISWLIINGQAVIQDGDLTKK